MTEKISQFDVIKKEINRLVTLLNGDRAIFAMQSGDDVLTYHFTHPNKSSTLEQGAYLGAHLISSLFETVKKEQAQNNA